MKNTSFNRILGMIAVVLLLSSKALAASDYLLEIQGVKGECNGKQFTLTENKDGSFTATNIPGGTYKLVYKPKVVVAGSNSVSTSTTFMQAKVSLTFEAIISPRDAASGLPTGKRQHKPLTITKELDNMSPPGTTIGEIIVGDLDGDGLAERSRVNSTNPPENAGRAAGYDLKLNKKL